MTESFTHPLFIHTDGTKCIWIKGAGWFVPTDVGGEGYGCTLEHPPGPLHLDSVRRHDQMLKWCDKDECNVSGPHEHVMEERIVILNRTLTPEEREEYGLTADHFPPKQIVYDLASVEALLRKEREKLFLQMLKADSPEFNGG